jgi:AmmeMemoRadiSam system protein B
MLKLLQSSNKARSFVALFCLLVFLYIVLPKTQFVAPEMYHESHWNEYGKEIDSAVANSRTPEKLSLSHVYGMVLPHHIPTTYPELVEYYGALGASQSVKNIIVIGPDHTDAGKDFVTVSNEKFVTVYGEVEPIPGLAQKLSDLHLANIEEAPFDPEHSVGAHILLISKMFPEAHVTPIIIKSHTSSSQAEALGKALASMLDDETVLVASVDFSHYLTTGQAYPIDVISGEVIKNLDIEALPLIKADSGHSMQIFMTAMKEKNAIETEKYQVLNTSDLCSTNDYTTGYVFGFWGIK